MRGAFATMAIITIPIGNGSITYKSSFSSYCKPILPESAMFPKAHQCYLGILKIWFKCHLCMLSITSSSIYNNSIDPHQIVDHIDIAFATFWVAIASLCQNVAFMTSVLI
jgi:hypothetical protein